MEWRRLAESVTAVLRESGIPLVGTCTADVDPLHAEAFSSWLSRGQHGPLLYMARNAGVRLDPGRLEPWARGVFCVGIPYNTRRDLSAQAIAAGRAWVSRYAWGRDYHRVLRGRMEPAATLLREAGFKARVCVDTVPLLERHLAWRAGLGFIGKNGLLIHPSFGSYLFLGEIVTDLELPDGQEIPDGCGACVLCLKGCPARALGPPRVLDARRCLSTWTIEHRGPFPPETPSLAGHLFGCDRCQEVCPYNRKAPLSENAEFMPRAPWLAPEPGAIAEMTAAAWDEATAGTAVRRARHDGLLRNARRILEEKSEVGRRKAEGRQDRQNPRS